jgi:uncharacterized membrane protein
LESLAPAARLEKSTREKGSDYVHFRLIGSRQTDARPGAGIRSGHAFGMRLQAGTVVGRRSAALIGGGAGLGMLVGGVATGGVGLLVGGMAGGGAGTAVAGLTGNRDLEIPAESIVHFKVADDLVVQPGQ